MSDQEFIGATPERLARASGPAGIIETVDDAGKTIRTQRVMDAPLERLYRAGGLGSNEEIAAWRYEAGQMLYSSWYYGRLVPLGSRDYRKPYSGTSDHFAIMPAGERQALARQRWRAAEACLGSDRIAGITLAIVIDEKPVADVGMLFTERTDRAQARAVATEMLIDGLDRLVKLWRRK